MKPVHHDAMPDRDRAPARSPIFEAYFRPRRFEARVYERIGVRRFKRWMLALVGQQTAHRLGWRLLPGSRADTRAALRSFEKRTRHNEAVHALVLAALAAVAVHLLARGEAAAAVALLVVNIPFNVYPLLLQRHTRLRLKRLLATGRQAG
jgi:hypothetical protein